MKLTRSPVLLFVAFSTLCTSSAQAEQKTRRIFTKIAIFAGECDELNGKLYVINKKFDPNEKREQLVIDSDELKMISAVCAVDNEPVSVLTWKRAFVAKSKLEVLDGPKETKAFSDMSEAAQGLIKSSLAIRTGTAALSSAPATPGGLNPSALDPKSAPTGNGTPGDQKSEKSASAQSLK